MAGAAAVGRVVVLMGFEGGGAAAEDGIAHTVVVSLNVAEVAAFTGWQGRAISCSDPLPAYAIRRPKVAEGIRGAPAASVCQAGVCSLGCGLAGERRAAAAIPF